MRARARARERERERESEKEKKKSRCPPRFSSKFFISPPLSAIPGLSYSSGNSEISLTLRVLLLLEQHSSKHFIDYRQKFVYK